MIIQAGASREMAWLGFYRSGAYSAMSRSSAAQKAQ
jgi:hypothetical protein